MSAPLSRRTVMVLSLTWRAARYRAVNPLYSTDRQRDRRSGHRKIIINKCADIFEGLQKNRPFKIICTYVLIYMSCMYEALSKSYAYKRIKHTTLYRVFGGDIGSSFQEEGDSGIMAHCQVECGPSVLQQQQTYRHIKTFNSYIQVKEYSTVRY